MTLIDKACFERGCACYDSRDKGECVEITEKREWVGLTDDEVFAIWMKSPAETEDRFAFVKTVMKELKERNT